MVRMIQKKIGKCLLLFMVVVGIALASRDTSEAASEEMVAFEDYLVSNSFGRNSTEIYTKYIDLNNDDNKEMAIVYPSGNQYKLRICTHVDNEVRAMNSKDLELKEWGNVSGQSDQIFIRTVSGTIIVYQVQDTKLVKKETYSSKKDRGKVTYFKNNKKISKNSYLKKIKAFKTIKAKKYSFNMALNKTKTKVYLGKTKTLSVSGTIATVQWESRNKQVATVNDNGVVTGIEEGNAVIVAKIGKYKLYCDVTVEFDEESAKKNIEVKTWANYSYGEVYVEMTNHNDFPVVVNGSGKFYDAHDEPVYSRGATGYTTILPECTAGVVCDSDGEFYSYTFDFSLRRAFDREAKEEGGSKYVTIEKPVITPQGVSVTVQNNYDEDLRISLICAWCRNDGTFERWLIKEGEVGYGNNKEYIFDFYDMQELNTGDLTCKVQLHWSIVDN